MTHEAMAIVAAANTIGNTLTLPARRNGRWLREDVTVQGRVGGGEDKNTMIDFRIQLARKLALVCRRGGVFEELWVRAATAIVRPTPQPRIGRTKNGRRKMEGEKWRRPLVHLSTHIFRQALFAGPRAGESVSNFSS
jgi:hypothetical protein